MSDGERYLEWLLQFGRDAPGTVLYPTSDDATYLHALRLEDLSRVFRMYQPGVDVMMRLLDKKLLYDGAREFGLDVPETWFPESEGELLALARTIEMPVLVKPRTQILSRARSKGAVVTRRENLLACYRACVRRSHYGDLLVERFPETTLPLVQRYYPEAMDGIYEVSSFVDRSGALFAARASRKVLQQPRTLGIGLCFEHAPLDEILAEAVRRLAMGCGYFGVVQFEFIEVGDRRLLIDCNPRLYNQLAFDLARGLPLPEMVYAAAQSDVAELARLVAAAAQDPGPTAERTVFCNRFGVGLMVAAQRLSGRMSASEARHWRSWILTHPNECVDPTFAPDDALPAIMGALSQLVQHVRHPRAFVNQIVLNGRRSGRPPGMRRARGETARGARVYNI